ncbi:MAG: amino acid transporter, partial [Candidatus Eisenbacteria bacterium]
EPGVPRPYRLTGYPGPAVLFSLACVFLIVAAVRYRPWVAAAACGFIPIGLVVYRLSRENRRPGPAD